MDGWGAAARSLRGEQPWNDQSTVYPPPAILAATERRRTGPVARLALALAQEAVAISGLAPASLRSVFGSGNGDGITVGAVLEALTQPDGFVSPTLFHNSRAQRARRVLVDRHRIAAGGDLPRRP